jgi:hypothetical protein
VVSLITPNQRNLLTHCVKNFHLKLHGPTEEFFSGELFGRALEELDDYRDMYMRYAGGGVGHYRVTLTDTPANANKIQEDFAVDDDITADTPGLTILELEDRIIVAEAAAGIEEVEEEAERIQDYNILDHSSDSEGEEDDQ